ncbi:MAG TPA: hypothetical protein VHB47_11720 [Thermoanaerobaculia bacterium]|jgi:hypothetical protein|nr:hypothetical protein [Thermoanaerobaculia bacterium]
MKKSPKTLKLSKETLRGLADTERGEQWLAMIAAGVTGTCWRISGCPRCP